MYIEPTIKNILSQSWEIFQNNIKTILIVTLIIGIPLNMMLEFIPSGDDLEGTISYLRFAGFIQGLFGILATIAIAFIAKSAIEHKPITWQESLKLAINKWLQVIGTNFLEGVLLVLLFLLLILPGVIYMIFWYFAMYVAIFSDKWGLSALRHSKELVQYRWWKSFGFIILFGIMGILLGIVAGIPGSYVPENFVFYVMSNLLVDIALAYFSVLGAVFYLAWEASKIEAPIVLK